MISGSLSTADKRVLSKQGGKHCACWEIIILLSCERTAFKAEKTVFKLSGPRHFRPATRAEVVHGTFGRPRGPQLYTALSAGLAGHRCTWHFRPASRAIAAGAQHFRLPRRFVMPSTLGIKASVPGTFGHTAVGTSALSARHQALSASPAGIASPALSATQR